MECNNSADSADIPRFHRKFSASAADIPRFIFSSLRDRNRRE